MIVLSLYDLTGIMVQPWANAGHDCFIFDIQHPKEETLPFGRGTITKVNLDLDFRGPAWDIIAETFAGQEVMLMGFPVCTDLSISGALHWAEKRAIDDDFQHKAVAPFFKIEQLAKKLNARYMIENPKSKAGSLFRKQDYSFDPFEYGGYLPPDDVHPLYPTVISPRDAYEKETWIWAGNGFIMPEKKPVDPHYMLYRRGNGEILHVSEIVAKTGGDSVKTKNIRSATPRGFAEAVFWANGVFGVKEA